MGNLDLDFDASEISAFALGPDRVAQCNNCRYIIVPLG
jgi:hypothetical protein